MQTDLVVTEVVPAKAHGNGDAKDRARRFCLAFPLQFRVAGKHEWREGTTENISDSGVLFRSELAHPPGVTMEMRIALWVMPTRKSTELLCHATVVRALPAADGNEFPSLAVKFLSRRLARP